MSVGIHGNSLMADAGVDRLTRKYIMGHKTTDVDINDRYTHKKIASLVAAIDLI